MSLFLFEFFFPCRFLNHRGKLDYRVFYIFHVTAMTEKLCLGTYIPSVWAINLKERFCVIVQTAGNIVLKHVT